jgi:hypothetical protein
MPILRRIIFVLFSLIYLVCCPLIILWALGINLSPRSSQNLTKTGLISLSTLPSQATIYLDNLRYPQKTGAVIRNLVPGDYSVKVILRGFKMWEKTVQVKAETATVLENILLIPQKWQAQLLSLLQFEEIIPIHNNSFFVLKRGPLVQDFYLFRISERLPEEILPILDPSEKKAFLTPLFPRDTVYNQAKVISFVTTPESNCIFFQISLKGVEKFLWVDLRPRPVVIDDITDLMIKKPKKIFWDSHDTRNVFLYQDENITRLETAAKAIYPNIAEHVRGWGAYNQKLYLLSQDHILKKVNYDGKDQEYLLQDRSLVISYFGENAKYQIYVFPDNLILFLGEHGELLINRPPLILMEKDVKGFTFDESTQRLLVWTDHKLGIIDFSANNQRQFARPPSPRLTWMVDGAKDIEQAFWVNRASYFIYRDQDKIVLSETEKFNDPQSEELFKVKKNSPVVYSETSGKLYYLDSQRHNLCAQTIVPVQEMFNFHKEQEEEIK